MNKILIMVLFGVFVSFPVYAQVTLQDIELAVMDENFVQVNELSKQLVALNRNDPSANKALYYLGVSQIRLNQYGEALETFKGLMNTDLEPVWRDKVYIGMFDCYYITGNYSEAAEISLRLLKISPDSQLLSLIYLKAARVNLKLAQWETARDYLQKIVDDFPESFEFHIAKQLLDERQYFAVQVGAFVEQERATELMNELIKKNEYAYVVVTTDRDGQKFYRVRVGQLAQLDEAERLKNKLAQQGYPVRIYP